MSAWNRNGCVSRSVEDGCVLTSGSTARPAPISAIASNSVGRRSFVSKAANATATVAAAISMLTANRRQFHALSILLNRRQVHALPMVFIARLHRHYEPVIYAS